MDGTEYTLRRAILRLTQRGVQEATLCVSQGPLSPLTEMQSIQLRVALGAIIREAIGTGRWLERTDRARRERGEQDPQFDEDITEPMPPRG
jgi:chromosome segregation ATPase